MGLFEPESQPHDLERFARLALVMADRTVPPHTSRFSRRDFTQPQLFAVLLLRGRMNLPYRGVTRLLKSSPPLREALGLRKVPHWTTLERTANAPHVREHLDLLLTKLVAHMGHGERPLVEEAAIDSTGFESSVASAYYSRRAKKVSEFVKVSLAVSIGWMMPCALITSIGASNDNLQAPELVRKLSGNARVAVLYADAGYDGEPLHRLCREDFGIQSVIKPVPKTRDGSIKTRYRSMMVPLPDGYRRRAAVESVISAIKRSCGSRLRAMSTKALQNEVYLKVVAYAIA
jgi:hypothetical protein